MLPVGMISLSAVLMFTHFVQLPDFVSGALMGVAIGLLIIGVVNKKQLQEIGKDEAIPGNTATTGSNKS